MALILSIPGTNISVWITVDGVPAPIYQPQIDVESQSATCWIESKEGKPFSIHWRTDNYIRDYFIKPTLSIDGVNIRRTPSMGPLPRKKRKKELSMSSLRVSPTTKRQFEFAKVLLTDDEGARNTHCNIGTVEISFYSAIMQLDPQTSRFKARKSPLEDIGAIHERSKKAAVHRVRLGATHNKPVKNGVDFKLQHKLATFSFHYQSRDVLKAERIIPVSAAPARIQPEDIIELDDDGEIIETIPVNAKIELQDPAIPIREPPALRVKREPIRNLALDEVLDLTI